MRPRLFAFLISIIPTFIIVTVWVLKDPYFWTQDGVLGPFFYSPIFGLSSGAVCCSFFHKYLPKFKVFSYIAVSFLSALVSPFIVMYGFILATII